MDRDDEGEDTVTVRFVIPKNKTEFTVSESMGAAHELCGQNGFTAEWVEEERVLDMSPTKTVTFIQGDLDVFVVETFEGPIFKHLTKGDKIKCTLLGPKALIACLQTNTPVPNLPYPMYTLAMKGLQITCSSIKKEDKLELQDLIQKMAGIYCADFHDGITHVVAGGVTSDKYKVAVETSTHVMTKEWVYEVWKASCKELVSAVDPRFVKYKCPVFLGLAVCVSQLSKEDKHILKKKIESHGGRYLAELPIDETNLLVCMTANGPKYEAAKKWKIPCVKPEWILHSIDKGYALPMEDYKIDKKNKSSTPTKDTTAGGDNLTDVSMCSTIINPNDSAINSRIDETVNTTAFGTIAPEIQGKSTKDWLDELELTKVKKAGHFLDGLRIYLSGFSEAEHVQMNRVLKYAGATRLTQLVDSVTHVVHSVTKNVDPDTARIIRDLDISPHMVSLEWIVESMKRGHKLTEQDYVFPPPPQENKDKLSRTVIEQPAADETVTENQILNQYKQNNTTSAPDVSKKESQMEATSAMEASSQIDPFFSDIKFELAGLTEDMEQDFTEWITEVGGEVMFSDYTGQVDFLITPMLGGKGKLKHKEHVTNLWMDDCFDECRLVPREYYHYPIKQNIEGAPLKGIVTCVSGYVGRERGYISEVISLLGGNPQEMFAKKDNKDKGLLASTHLICNAPEGPKYTAAIKWKIPIVDKDWIRACLKECKWISEQPFLIGDSSTFTKDKPRPSVSLDDETTLVENQDTMNEVDHQEPQEDTVLQDIDPNQSSMRGRRSIRNSLEKSKSVIDKVNTSMKNSPHCSPAMLPQLVKSRSSPALRQDDEAASRTPGLPANKLADAKTPGLTPGGLERVRKPLDMYSPLPSQPWPDSQPDMNTPAPATGTKRKRGAADLEEMPTPKTPYGGHLGGDPSPDTRKMFKKRKDEIGKLAEYFKSNETDKIDSQKRRQQDWLQKKSSTSGAGKNTGNDRWCWRSEDAVNRSMNKGGDSGDSGKGGRSKQTLDEKMKELYKDMGKDWDEVGRGCAGHHNNLLNKEGGGRELEEEVGEEEGDKCLQGLNIFISRKIAQMDKDIEGVIRELGGHVSDLLDSDTTHYIFQGKQKDLSKEFRQAKELGKIIVAPEWIYTCRTENRRVDEEAFPYTYNPSKLVNQSQRSAANSSAVNKNRSRLSKVKLPQPDMTLQNDETEIRERKVSEEDTILEAAEEESRLEESTVQADKTEVILPQSETKASRGSFKADVKALESLVETLKNSPAVSIYSSAKKEKQAASKANKSISENITPKSTPVRKVEEKLESQVLWVDPEEERNREAMALKLSMETPDIGSINFSENMTSTNLEMSEFANRDMNEESDDESSPRVFTVTAGIDENKAKDLILSLGGEYCNNISPDSLPTHVIAAKVSRSEKMLQCIASGRWILHPSYLEASRLAGKWLKEDKYEMGNPENDLCDLTANSHESKMSIAARRRRLAAEQGAPSIFSGMTAYLALPAQKQGAFLRLIKSGGGSVLKELSPDEIKNVTHVITENKYYNLIQSRADQLSELCIPVIVPIYLNDYLISEAHPIVDKYLVDQYRTLWDKRKKNRELSDSLSSSNFLFS